jgi:hypothetical protein
MGKMGNYYLEDFTFFVDAMTEITIPHFITLKIVGLLLEGRITALKAANPIQFHLILPLLNPNLLNANKDASRLIPKTHI